MQRLPKADNNPGLEGHNDVLHITKNDIIQVEYT